MEFLGIWASQQAGRLREPAHDIHALYRLAAGAFDEVVLGAHYEQPSRAWIESPGNFEDVGARDVLGVRQRLGIEQANEGFMAVGRFVAGGNLLTQLIHAFGIGEMLFRREIKRGEDTAIYRDQM